MISSRTLNRFINLQTPDPPYNYELIKYIQTDVLHSNFLIIILLYLEIVGDPDGHKQICLELSPLLSIRDAARALSAQLTLQVRHTALKRGPQAVGSICQIQNVGINTFIRFLEFIVKNRCERLDNSPLGPLL
jgi:hypothetical protein